MRLVRVCVAGPPTRFRSLSPSAQQILCRVGEVIIICSLVSADSASPLAVVSEAARRLLGLAPGACSRSSPLLRLVYAAFGGFSAPLRVVSAGRPLLPPPVRLRLSPPDCVRLSLFVVCCPLSPRTPFCLSLPSLRSVRFFGRPPSLRQSYCYPQPSRIIASLPLSSPRSGGSLRFPLTSPIEIFRVRRRFARGI